ncbi:hypothetical protein [Proteus myxofaciens]|uniref:hypothetical protein n=1 Tax=Proteus myxofaciens TaxID=184072 RepID=UPI00082E6DA1|nr:hypothetical protein [Proteus myxofaciens]
MTFFRTVTSQLSRQQTITENANRIFRIINNDWVNTAILSDTLIEQFKYISGWGAKMKGKEV